MGIIEENRKHFTLRGFYELHNSCTNLHMKAKTALESIEKVENLITKKRLKVTSFRLKPYIFHMHV
ncbi:hypothetical protein T01_5276 [Trichinella spiralis]|uniref:Uncharacterized protein n=1 Tax=Trichinella spiralis TaxID=6334 RepID=A0A0V1BNI3_TRISP|nr:hypothetical protein T01_5276 [Trichinella spiralis]